MRSNFAPSQPPAWLCLAVGLLACWSSPSQALNVVGKFNDWTVYANGEAAARVCFLAAAPSISEPADVQRDRALLYISAWPKDGVKSEVSIRLGFTARRGTDPSGAVTGAVAISVRLFVREDRAYVADPTQELKLLDAMKKGSKLTIQATSQTGRTTTDTYSLSGITAALQALASNCT